MVKRMFDLALAAIALVFLAPIFAVVALAVRTQMGRPVLFGQRRPGLKGKPFCMWKFRTMTAAQDPDGRDLPDDQRLVPLGRWLRAWSLDELPELWNVVNGDMSLVGPRPLLMEYLDRYTPEQMRRHDAKPGITGWAQVNGRNALSWEEKFAYDLWYVDHRTVLFDLRILAMTALRILDRKGISAPGHSTMPIFMGSRTAKRPASAVSGRRIEKL